MERFVLDSNVFIEMKNGPYGFEIAPRFWEWIEREAEAGILYSSSKVYRELSDYHDELAVWVKARAESKLFIEPDVETQVRYRDIADYAETAFPPHRVSKFLEGADPWVIAQAWRDGTTVITQEGHVDASSRKPKIPNICEHFGVEYMNLYQLVRLRNLRLSG
jgi:Domain of unknown function (DUF4411)